MGRNTLNKLAVQKCPLTFLKMLNPVNPQGYVDWCCIEVRIMFFVWTIESARLYLAGERAREAGAWSGSIEVRMSIRRPLCSGVTVSYSLIDCIHTDKHAGQKPRRPLPPHLPGRAFCNPLYRSLTCSYAAPTLLHLIVHRPTSLLECLYSL